MSQFTLERIYVSAIEQSNCLKAIADKEATQKVIAGFYADCIRADGFARLNNREKPDFGVINRAITQRWAKGLNRVKEMAWKLVKGG